MVHVLRIDVLSRYDPGSKWASLAPTYGTSFHPTSQAHSDQTPLLQPKPRNVA